MTLHRDPGRADRGERLSGPLAGLRVLDITTVIMGPYATAQLGDMGADVIKVELPAGDIARQLGPCRSAGMSTITLNLGRNKRSAVLDRGETEDHERLAELVATCDVIITNLRPGSRRRLGLDWDEVHQANPAAILCTAQAFASESEKGEEPACADVIQAVSGMPDLYRRAFGTPQFSPSVLADKICGLVIVNSVLAALHSRATTGEGQWVDVPMADTMLAFNWSSTSPASLSIPRPGKSDGAARSSRIAGRITLRTGGSASCPTPTRTGPTSSVPSEGPVSPRTPGSPAAVPGTRITPPCRPNWPA